MQFQVVWSYPTSRWLRTAIAVLGLMNLAMALGVSLPTRQLPESYDAPEPVRWFFGHPWWATGLLAAFGLSVIIFVMAGAWEGVFRLSQFRAFRSGDAVWLPLAFACWAGALSYFEGSDRLYVQREFFWAMIGLAVAFSAFNALNDAVLAYREAASVPQGPWLLAVRQKAGWAAAFGKPYSFCHVVTLTIFVALGLCVLPTAMVSNPGLALLGLVFFFVYARTPQQDLADKQAGKLPLPGRTISTY